ncbi:MAG: type II toxin-antitoxin system RelE/ParE family toxin [Paracoccus sp. (in: a-proteobacteria)]
MYRIQRSALFKRQFLEITTGYRDRAGSAVALDFVDRIDESIRFIASKPRACATYTTLRGIEFRKWRVSGFPVSVFFRISGESTIILEALYAHRMNIAARFPDEIG